MNVTQRAERHAWEFHAVGGIIRQIVTRNGARFEAHRLTYDGQGCVIRVRRLSCGTTERDAALRAMVYRN